MSFLENLLTGEFQSTEEELNGADKKMAQLKPVQENIVKPLNLKSNIQRPVPNYACRYFLEYIFSKYQSPSKIQMVSLSGQINVPYKVIMEWFVKRKALANWTRTEKGTPEKECKQPERCYLCDHNYFIEADKLIFNDTTLIPFEVESHFFSVNHLRELWRHFLNLSGGTHNTSYCTWEKAPDINQDFIITEHAYSKLCSYKKLPTFEELDKLSLSAEVNTTNYNSIKLCAEENAIANDPSDTEACTILTSYNNRKATDYLTIAPYAQEIVVTSNPNDAEPCTTLATYDNRNETDNRPISVDKKNKGQNSKTNGKMQTANVENNINNFIIADSPQFKVVNFKNRKNAVLPLDKPNKSPEKYHILKWKYNNAGIPINTLNINIPHQGMDCADTVQKSSEIVTNQNKITKMKRSNLTVNPNRFILLKKIGIFLGKRNKTLRDHKEVKRLTNQNQIKKPNSPNHNNDIKRKKTEGKDKNIVSISEDHTHRSNIVDKNPKTKHNKTTKLNKIILEKNVNVTHQNRHFANKFKIIPKESKITETNNQNKADSTETSFKNNECTKTLVEEKSVLTKYNKALEIDNHKSDTNSSESSDDISRNGPNNLALLLAGDPMDDMSVIDIGEIKEEPLEVKMEEIWEEEETHSSLILEPMEYDAFQIYPIDKKIEMNDLTSTNVRKESRDRTSKQKCNVFLHQFKKVVRHTVRTKPYVKPPNNKPQFGPKRKHKKRQIDRWFTSASTKRRQRLGRLQRKLKKKLHSPEIKKFIIEKNSDALTNNRSKSNEPEENVVEIKIEDISDIVEDEDNLGKIITKDPNGSRIISVLPDGFFESTEYKYAQLVPHKEVIAKNKRDNQKSSTNKAVFKSCVKKEQVMSNKKSCKETQTKNVVIDTETGIELTAPQLELVENAISEITSEFNLNKRTANKTSQGKNPRKTFKSSTKKTAAKNAKRKAGVKKTCATGHQINAVNKDHVEINQPKIERLENSNTLNQSGRNSLAEDMPVLIKETLPILEEKYTECSENLNMPVLEKEVYRSNASVSRADINTITERMFVKSKKCRRIIVNSKQFLKKIRGRIKNVNKDYVGVQSKSLVKNQKPAKNEKSKYSFKTNLNGNRDNVAFVSKRPKKTGGSKMLSCGMNTSEVAPENINHLPKLSDINSSETRATFKELVIKIYKLNLGQSVKLELGSHFDNEPVTVQNSFDSKTLSVKINKLKFEPEINISIDESNQTTDASIEEIDQRFESVSKKPKMLRTQSFICDKCQFKCTKKVLFKNHIIWCELDKAKENKTSLDYEGKRLVIDLNKVDNTDLELPSSPDYEISSDDNKVLGKIINSEFYEGKKLVVKLKRLNNELRMFRCRFCNFMDFEKNTVKFHANKCPMTPRNDNDTTEKISNYFKVFKCLYCSHTHQDIKMVKRHAKFHSKISINRCPHCSYSVWSRISFYKHVKSHETFGTVLMYKCYFCNYRTPDKEVFTKHTESRHTSNVLNCGNCSYSTPLRASMIRHQQQSHRSKGLIKLKKSKLTHKTSEDSPSFYKCRHCPFKHHRKVKLERHEENHNGLRSGNKCPFCSYRGQLYKHLPLHKNDHTPEEKKDPYNPEKSMYITSLKKCPHCPYKTWKTSTFKRHQFTHLNLEDIKKTNGLSCKECPFKTNRNNLLKEHSAKHKATEGHKCPHCSFRTTNKLAVHLRWHNMKEGTSF